MVSSDVLGVIMDTMYYYDQGKRANYRGDTTLDNPYKEGSEEYYSWLDGWNAMDGGADYIHEDWT